MLRQTQFVPPVPVVVAQRRGLLDAAGVEIEFETTRGSAEQLARLGSGEVDLAVTAIDNVFMWSRAGHSFRVIAQVERTTPLTLFARPGLTGLTDLAGRRFAVDARDNGFALAALRVLREAGVEVELVEVGGVRERQVSLQAGETDASLLGPPFDTLAREGGLSEIATINALLPGYPGQGLVVRADVIERRRDELRAYLEVLAAATTWAAEADDAAGIEALTDSGLPRQAAEVMWSTRARSLWPATEGLRVVESVRRDLGMLPEQYGGLDELRADDFQSLLDRRPLPEKES